MAKTLDFFAVDKAHPKTGETKRMMAQYHAAIRKHGLFAPETNALRQALGQQISEYTTWLRDA